MERVLVLGANGFIGRHLVQSLSKTTFVIGYGRSQPSPNTCSAFIIGNFVQEKNWTEILLQYHIDVVYHLISTTSPSIQTVDIEAAIIENIIPTVRLLEAMKNTGVRRIIFASSGGTVYGEGRETAHKTTDTLQPICTYGIEKVTAELYMQLYEKLYGMQCIIARIGNAYGLSPQKNRRQGIIPIFLRNNLSRKPITLYGDTVRDYIYIDDVIDAMVLLGIYRGNVRIFNIGTGVGTSLKKIIYIIEEISGKTFSAIYEQPTRTCDVMANILDISATRVELGWEPKVKIMEGIEMTFYKLKEMEGLIDGKKI